MERAYSAALPIAYAALRPSAKNPTIAAFLASSMRPESARTTERADG